MLAGASGFTSIPRKMSGSAMRTIEELSTAMSTPRVVFDSAIHL